MSGLCDLYDYPIHDLQALLAAEGFALRVVPLSPPEPAERGVIPSPFDHFAPAGEGDHIEVTA